MTHTNIHLSWLISILVLFICSFGSLHVCMCDLLVSAVDVWCDELSKCFFPLGNLEQAFGFGRARTSSLSHKQCLFMACTALLQTFISFNGSPKMKNSGIMHQAQQNSVAAFSINYHSAVLFYVSPRVLELFWRIFWRRHLTLYFHRVSRWTFILEWTVPVRTETPSSTYTTHLIHKVWSMKAGAGQPVNLNCGVLIVKWYITEFRLFWGEIVSKYERFHIVTVITWQEVSELLCDPSRTIQTNATQQSYLGLKLPITRKKNFEERVTLDSLVFLLVNICQFVPQGHSS